MNMKPRQRRLLNEFHLITKLQTEESLFQFLCGRLSVEDADHLQRGKYKPPTLEEIKDDFTHGYHNYLTPEDYLASYPDTGPEKYLIRYDCVGMTYKESAEFKGFRLEEESPFLVEILYGLDFPVERPMFICLTKNVWHPNIRYPYICVEGRPFPAGVTLEYLIPMIGRMFQYQEYNLNSIMNSDAASWAYHNASYLPIDDRDMLSKHRHLSKKAHALPAPSQVSIRSSSGTETDEAGQPAAVELLDIPTHSPQPQQQIDLFTDIAENQQEDSVELLPLDEDIRADSGSSVSPSAAESAALATEDDIELLPLDEEESTDDSPTTKLPVIKRRPAESDED
ncbi:MAG TPA: hypothetical protein VL485_05205 [Ktedonobacteraceae bacterium]|nr:hypothetical protein [Ktedonobacteraceae bacterium]